jgi:general stress protein YciG
VIRLAQQRKKGQMSVEEAGRLGGQKGGRRTAETHNHKFYEDIGRKGGQKVRELIREGREHEDKRDA